MLSNSETCYCERKCFEIIRSSKSRSEAKKRIAAFKYKGISLSNNQIDECIRYYISAYGTIGSKKHKHVKLAKPAKPPAKHKKPIKPAKPTRRVRRVDK